MWKFRLIKSEFLKAQKLYFYGLISCCLIMPSVMALPVYYQDLNHFNLSKAKMRLKQYYESGSYHKGIERVATKAINYIRFRSEANQGLENPQKLAVVLDIDETALSNYKTMSRLNFGGTLNEIKAAEQQANDVAIPEILQVYKVAQKNQVTVFFITGRNEAERDSTVKNLKLVGYQHWQKLYMKPNNYDQDSAVPFKTEIRKKIKEMGYSIIANIGDQQSDLKGGYAEMSFKLPNPFYYIS